MLVFNHRLSWLNWIFYFRVTTHNLTHNPANTPTKPHTTPTIALIVSVAAQSIAPETIKRNNNNSPTGKATSGANNTSLKKLILSPCLVGFAYTILYSTAGNFFHCILFFFLIAMIFMEAMFDFSLLPDLDCLVKTRKTTKTIQLAFREYLTSPVFIFLIPINPSYPRSIIDF